MKAHSIELVAIIAERTIIPLVIFCANSTAQAGRWNGAKSEGYIGLEVQPCAKHHHIVLTPNFEACSKALALPVVARQRAGLRSNLHMTKSAALASQFHPAYHKRKPEFRTQKAPPCTDADKPTPALRGGCTQ
eukprot:3647408-Amphidinium_carterae.1